MAATWATTLADLGAQIETRAGAAYAVAGDSRAAMRVLRRSRMPRPVELDTWMEPAEATLLVLPHVSPGVAQRLEALGISYVTDDGISALLQRDGAWLRSPQPQVRPTGLAGGKQRRWGAGASRVVHALLLAHGYPTQVGLSEQANVTQAHVSKVLHSLEAEDLVHLHSGRLTHVDHEALMRAWLAHRRYEPITTWWVGPPDLAESWDELAPALVDPVISGDVAVDALAPARRPRQLVVHARTWGAQGVTGMVTVETLEEATVVLHLTDDQIVLGSSLRASWRGRNVPIADAMQLTYDLQSATGPDASTANAAWLKHLLGREP